jgi:hypothetical protein
MIGLTAINDPVPSESGLTNRLSSGWTDGLGPLINQTGYPHRAQDERGVVRDHPLGMKPSLWHRVRLGSPLSQRFPERFIPHSLTLSLIG